MKIILILTMFTILTQTACNQNTLPVSENYLTVDAIEFEKLVSSGDGLILDIRTVNEYNQGHIKGAILVDFYSPDFKEKLDLLDKDKPVYMYCRSGNRSGKTLVILNELGFTKVYNLKSGITEWNAKNYPVEK